MKSLSVSAATFAVAVSLASTAQANEALAYGESDNADQAYEEQAPLSAPVDRLEDARIEVEPFAFDLGEPALSTPPAANAPMAPIQQDGPVTARSIDPNYGKIDPFYGDIDAFWRDISPFYGDINPFYRDISPFWRDISPFYGDIKAFWGDIDAFWRDIAPFDTAYLSSLADFWGSTNEFWLATNDAWAAAGDNTLALAAVQLQLNEIVSRSEGQFGTRVTDQAGNSTFDELASEILSRHGLDLNDPTTLANKSDAERAAFFLDWHDSLMQYSGIDQVDHWMGSINWTPAITQIQGAGQQTVIGIVDGSFSSDHDLGNNVVWSGGGTNTVSGHGAGVASLIAGAHDGQGVMGIAPSVKIATYNPFDSNQMATWDSVGDGIEALLHHHVGGNQTGYASIINLSLGESGWAFSQGLADVLNRSGIVDFNHETIYVVAAGNDGVSQIGDINWNFGDDTSFILVGSANPNGEIADWSNRPGDACLLDNGQCFAGNELYMRTVVAPGTMLLVSDGMGGVTRASGTSFSAPLVSGAVSLLHDRWPWLARHPHETAEIIFRSAQDLGAPGPDEIYGWGMLDVVASQSPLNFNDLDFTIFYRERKSYRSSQLSASYVLANGLLSRWEDMDVYFTLFENIGGTYRDFAVPMSSMTRGTQTDALGYGYQSMQDFVADRFTNWFLSNGADSDGDGTLGFSQVERGQTRQTGDWTLQYEAIMPRFTNEGLAQPVHNAVTLTNPNGDLSFSLGHGQGALALSGDRFGFISDHDRDTGGVNPVLGFASGELFASASYKVAPNTTVRFGFSDNRQGWDEVSGLTEGERAAFDAFDAHKAHAFTFDVEHDVTKNISINAQFTHLSEDNALLGAQSASAELLGDGAKTSAVTLSATVDFGDDFSFELSATGAETKTGQGQALVSDGATVSTAGQVALSKRGIVTGKDALRVSVGQPLTVERGRIELNSLGVIDRQTGETGMVTQTFSIETKRRYTGEIVYATELSDDSEFGVFGRYVSAGKVGEEESYMVGANLGWRF